MELTFDENATEDKDIKEVVLNCLKDLTTLESTKGLPIMFYQDGKSQGYYVKCCMLAEKVSHLLDMDAKLNPTDAESFRANRELLVEREFHRFCSLFGPL